MVVLSQKLSQRAEGPRCDDRLLDLMLAEIKANTLTGQGIGPGRT